MIKVYKSISCAHTAGTWIGTVHVGIRFFCDISKAAAEILQQKGKYIIFKSALFFFRRYPTDSSLPDCFACLLTVLQTIDRTTERAIDRTFRLWLYVCAHVRVWMYLWECLSLRLDCMICFVDGVVVNISQFWTFDHLRCP